MEEKKVREPIQARSIDKKNKIIDAAYEVFTNVGYYNANTTEIAKKAGVSIGILYGYFKDKKDILIYVIDIYIKKVACPIMDYFTKLTKPVEIRKVICDLIELTTTIHKKNANLHNILHSLTVSNEHVRQRFLSLEEHITINATETLKNLGVSVIALAEKVHIAMNSIQSFSHEYVYDRHEYIDYDKMKTETINMLNTLLA